MVESESKLYSIGDRVVSPSPTTHGATHAKASMTRQRVGRWNISMVQRRSFWRYSSAQPPSSERLRSSFRYGARVGSQPNNPTPKFFAKLSSVLNGTWECRLSDFQTLA